VMGFAEGWFFLALLISLMGMKLKEA